MHDKTAYGKGLADETKKALNAAGMKEALYESVNQGDKDFSALVSKMKQANIGAIYYGGYFTEAGLLIRQAKEQGLDAVLMGGDALASEEYWKITGATGEKTLMTFSPDPRNMPSAKAAVAEFKAQGYDPEGYTLYTYAALQVFAEAAAKAKSTKAERSRQGDAGRQVQHGHRHHRLRRQGRRDRARLRRLSVESRQIRRNQGIAGAPIS